MSTGNNYINFALDAQLRSSANYDTGTPSYWLALFTTTCTATSLGTELAYTGYARVEIPRDYNTFFGTQNATGAASNGTSAQIKNAIPLDFPENTGTDATWRYWAIVTTSTPGTGNVERFGDMGSLQTAIGGTKPTVYPNGYTLTVTT